METKQDVETWIDEQQERWGTSTDVNDRLVVFTEIYDTVPSHLLAAAIVYDAIKYHRRHING